MTLKWMAILAVGVLSVQSNAQEKGALTTGTDKVSYVIGVDMARNLKRQGIDVDVDFLAKGLRDGLSGERLLIPEGDFRQTLVEVQTSVRQKQALTRGQPLPELNKKRGETFLAENKTKDGVVALPSGLQYRILKAGDGPKPTDADTVECNYRGTLMDGTQVVGTNPGQPATLKVKEADVAGMKEALRLMPAGSKWRLFVPSELAYGMQGLGRGVGPNELLIFDLELIAIK
jgi:FKBP-type peptidyl-prolyl cis-trans isomerase